MEGIKAYLIHVGDATSQWVNVVFLFSDNPNESISGRAFANKGKSKAWYYAYRLINEIFFLQADHCREAWMNDFERAQRLINKN